ncbi:hypothetical protein DFS33DRAFT_1411136 [Desarmillaria ectypa]|nr:hypothetical protein DFS33DRAFT_1411136 [Desarmillaria ectypa]
MNPASGCPSLSGDLITPYGRSVSLSSIALTLVSRLGAVPSMSLSENFVRLTLKRPPHFHRRPGQAAYLIMPGVSRLLFECHLFTIAGYDNSRLKEKTVFGSQQPTELEGVGVFGERSEGFTHRLAAIRSDKGSVQVFIDGPYGSPPDLSSFDTSVFVLLAVLGCRTRFHCHWTP